MLLEGEGDRGGGGGIGMKLLDEKYINFNQKK